MYVLFKVAPLNVLDRFALGAFKQAHAGQNQYLTRLAAAQLSPNALTNFIHRREHIQRRLALYHVHLCDTEMSALRFIGFPVVCIPTLI